MGEADIISMADGYRAAVVNEEQIILISMCCDRPVHGHASVVVTAACLNTICKICLWRTRQAGSDQLVCGDADPRPNRH